MILIPAVQHETFSESPFQREFQVIEPVGMCLFVHNHKNPHNHKTPPPKRPKSGVLQWPVRPPGWLGYIGDSKYSPVM